MLEVHGVPRPNITKWSLLVPIYFTLPAVCLISDPTLCQCTPRLQHTPNKPLATPEVDGKLRNRPPKSAKPRPSARAEGIRGVIMGIWRWSSPLQLGSTDRHHQQLDGLSQPAVRPLPRAVRMGTQACSRKNWRSSYLETPVQFLFGYDPLFLFGPD